MTAIVFIFYRRIVIMSDSTTKSNQKGVPRLFYPLHPVGSMKFKCVGHRRPTTYLNSDVGDSARKEANRKKKDPETGKQTYVYQVNSRIYIWDPTNKKIRVYMIKERSPRTVTRTIAGQVKTLVMQETKVAFLGVFIVDQPVPEKFEIIQAASWKPYRSGRTAKTSSSAKPQPAIGKLTAKKSNRKK